jgi:hypothetical protein
MATNETNGTNAPEATEKEGTYVFLRVLGFIMFTAGIVFWFLWMNAPCSILSVLAGDGYSEDKISMCEALLSYSCIVLGIGILLLSRMGEIQKQLT